MKKTPQILFLLACLAACTQQKNDTTIVQIDTLARSEFRTTHNSKSDEDHRTKSLTYFLEINKDSSEISFKINQSKEYGLTMSTYYYPKYSKKTKNYEQRLNELEKLLPLAQKDFPLDSLQTMSLGPLASLANIAIEISKKSQIKTNEIQDKDYPAINQLIFESKFTTDLNRIFKPYGVSVAAIRCEKLWLHNRAELIAGRYFTDKDNLPEKLIDGAMLHVAFKRSK
jgi:hypothetical protein